ncbi:cyclic nucleotide-binding protein [Mycobacterium bohemicum DSM 44277]|uniref:Cyclic nucleotide-binding protein n=1 Tax=Mycobacterium bohemicum DSM 44277 TaxID=1236609 RepID=A0A0U0WF30_MYCBE|nr:cyclic nucleotide-binding domain-containing protein [Mycobacterium bohemicum]CPR13590.1 cyclic nucleotide-binding protein [Mycobacterium bohemicum DSM 44277]
MKADAKGHEEEDVRRLREFAAFDKFTDSDLDDLVRAAHHTSQSKPWPLIREQTPSDDCYILLSGEVGVYVGHDRVAVLGPGEVIGESALRQGKLRSATVTTIGTAAEFERLFARLLEEIALRETMDAVSAKHVAVDLPAKPKSGRTKLNASVPAELAERFEQAAGNAGVAVAAALEDALTQWIHRNGAADS